MTDFRTELTHRKRVKLLIGHATLRDLLMKYASETTEMPIDDVVEYEIKLRQDAGTWLSADVVITQDLTRYGGSDG